MEESNQNQRIRVPFTKDEDEKLTNLIKMYGDINWDLVSSLMPSNRTARQCRDRWVNWINVSYVKEMWSPAEDNRLIQKVKEIGPHWKTMEQFFPGRVSYKLRNRYSKLQKMKKTLNSTLPDEILSESASENKNEKDCDLKKISNNLNCVTDKCCCSKCEVTKEEKCNKICLKQASAFENIDDDEEQGFDWSENSWCRCINMANN